MFDVGCLVGCAICESGPGNKIGAYDFLSLKSVVDKAVKKFFKQNSTSGST